MTFRTKSLVALMVSLALAALMVSHGRAFAGSPFGIGTPETRGVAFTGPFGAFLPGLPCGKPNFINC